MNEIESISGTIVIQGAKPVPKAIYCNIREVVLQQQYFFETLWNKAVPAEKRIREIKEGVARTETRLLEQPSQIIKEIIQINEESNQLSICAVGGGIEFSYNFLFDEMKKLMDRHKKGWHKGIRYISYIDRANVEIIRSLLKLGVQIAMLKACLQWVLGFQIGK